MTLWYVQCVTGGLDAAVLTLEIQNWSPTWKACAIFSSLFSTFSMGFGPLALGPMFPLFIKDFDRSLADVVQFVGVCILVLGFSNLFWCVGKTSCRRPRQDRSVNRLPTDSLQGHLELSVREKIRSHCINFRLPVDQYLESGGEVILELLRRLRVSPPESLYLCYLIFAAHLLTSWIKD